MLPHHVVSIACRLQVVLEHAAESRRLGQVEFDAQECYLVLHRVKQIVPRFECLNLVENGVLVGWFGAPAACCG